MFTLYYSEGPGTTRYIVLVNRPESEVDEFIRKFNHFRAQWEKTRDGNAPQKTCAYGAQEVLLDGLKCDDLTGTSCSTETKREARRIRTSEFGLNHVPPAGVAAPAVNTPPQKTK